MPCDARSRPPIPFDPGVNGPLSESRSKGLDFERNARSLLKPILELPNYCLGPAIEPTVGVAERDERGDSPLRSALPLYRKSRKGCTALFELELGEKWFQRIGLIVLASPIAFPPLPEDFQREETQDPGGDDKPQIIKEIDPDRGRPFDVEDIVKG